MVLQSKMAIPKAVWGSWCHFQNIKIVCCARTGLVFAFCKLRGCHFHLTAGVRHRQGLCGLFEIWLLSLSVARAPNYVELILYNSVMLYYDSNVLMITKTFWAITQYSPVAVPWYQAASTTTFWPKYSMLLSFNDEDGCSVDCKK